MTLERGLGRIFNGRRHYRHDIQHRITNLIPKTILLFTLEFLKGEFGNMNWNLLGYKVTSDFFDLLIGQIGVPEFACFEGDAWDQVLQESRIQQQKHHVIQQMECLGCSLWSNEWYN